MRKMMLLAAMVAMAALMLAAAPAMANDNDKKFFDHDKKFFDHDDDDRKFFDDDDVRFVFRDDDDDFDFDFDSDFEQEADSGDVDQSFVVTNTGDNSNQCVGLQGVANTGNAQNQIGVTQFGDGFNNDFDRDRFFFDGFGDFDRDRRDRFFFRDFDFDGFNDDFEIEDSGADIEVSPTNTTRCDQQVNQAAAASSF